MSSEQQLVVCLVGNQVSLFSHWPCSDVALWLQQFAVVSIDTVSNHETIKCLYCKYCICLHTRSCVLLFILIGLIVHNFPYLHSVFE